MTAAVDLALAQLDQEIQALGTPADDTYAWFLLRAKVLSRSCILRMQQLEVHLDPTQAENFYRSALKAVKQTA